MKPTAIFSALICVVLTTTASRADLATCASYLKDRPGLDVKLLSTLLGKEPGQIEEMFVWLDGYCPENSSDSLVAAMRKFLAEWKPRR
jgi:hypothetical protein